MTYGSMTFGLVSPNSRATAYDLVTWVKPGMKKSVITSKGSLTKARKDAYYELNWRWNDIYKVQEVDIMDQFNTNKEMIVLNHSTKAEVGKIVAYQKNRCFWMNGKDVWVLNEDGTLGKKIVPSVKLDR